MDILGNLLEALLEAIHFLIWLVPILFQIFVAIFTPVIMLASVGLMAMAKGWEHTAETLAERWVDKGWQLEYINNHNAPFATQFVSSMAKVAIIAGIILDILIVVFAIWSLYQLANGFPVLFHDLHENNPWG